MRCHLLKIYPEYAKEVEKGLKTFEVRYNDRDFRVGDFIEFRVYAREGHCLDGYPINSKKYKITYILDNFIGLSAGYVAFSIKEVK